MGVTQVVIVDHTHSIDSTLLHNAALALDTQVSQHLTQYWNGITAHVSAAPRLSALTVGAWPVFLVKSLPPGEGGFHLDKHNQPYAKVIAAPDDDTWTIDASHEIVEMLVDPYGNRMQSSYAIAISGNEVIDQAGTFQYLVEACDPCEANDYAYAIGGVAVSDFITPHFYDSSATPGTRYSFGGNIERPRQLLPGGYISYVQPDGTWNQILWVDPNRPPQYRAPPVGSSSRSWREDIHRAMGAELDKAKHEQRRKKEGFPKALQARIAEQSSRRAAKDEHERLLREHYRLD
jgi:hypothetical protein